MKLDRIVELVCIISVVIFLTLISVWHAYGDSTSKAWCYLYHISNQLFMLSLSLMVWMFTDYSILRAIMIRLVAPYFLFKIIYNTLIHFNVNIGSDRLWEVIWSHVCILIMLVGAISVWKLLKRIG